MLARKMGSDPVLREIPVLIITGIREQIAYLFRVKRFIRTLSPWTSWSRSLSSRGSSWKRSRD